MEKYYYDGPLYCNGSKIASHTDVYTMAVSYKKACNNILSKLRRGDYNAAYDIDRSRVVLVDDNKKDLPKVDYTPIQRPICSRCGYELNDSGECPVCDLGEYDLLETLHELNEIV